MKKQLLAIVFILGGIQLPAQQKLDYFYNSSVKFNPAIPTPNQVLGFDIGQWHISHDNLVTYMKAIAKASERVTLKTTGYTYEHRPLLLATITSPSNQKNIEQLHQQHLALQKGQGNPAGQPVVVWLGHSIHGNEASGSNAAMLMMYYLAAAQGPEVETMLANTIILLDPSYNPDGLNRFASWVNSHKSKNPDPSPLSLEHNEAWPRGRTNHYWFDLNRDWLPAQHPESQARLAQFYDWMPNILTDQHEMNSNATYFFQPGIPSRNNPLTPPKVYELTGKIAAYHSQAMDAIGSQYYTSESFDDYYPGKGSTLPDLLGSIGILFEQASARGHVLATDNGILPFAFAIRNHVTTSLSTIKAAQELKNDLLNYQKNFAAEAKQLAQKDEVKGYIFSAQNNSTVANEFIKMINRHQINVQTLNQDYDKYSKENSYFVATNQRQYRLIKAMFEKRTTFKDSLFYDVSAWTLPLAFGLQYQAITSKQVAKIKAGSSIKEIQPVVSTIETSNYGYLLHWDSYLAPAALYQLQKAGLRTKLTTRNFTLEGKNYSRGTIFIPVQNQPLSNHGLNELMDKVAKKYSCIITPIATGYAQGVSLGSPTIEKLNQPTIALVAGQGVASYEVGEVWHLLDNRMDIAVSLIAIDQLNSANLATFNTIIMVNGNYAKLNADKIKKWVLTGGTIIATKNAGKWLAKNNISKVNYLENKPDSTQQRPYILMDRYNGAQVIGGAIFNTQADLSNPLFYGYSSNEIPVFRNSTIIMKRSKNAYANPLMYTNNPLLSGYSSFENLERLKASAAVQTDSFGKGHVITFTDNPNFRAFWYGTNRMFLNALFFGNTIRSR